MLGGSSRLQVQLRFLQALFKASNLVFGRRGCDRSHPRCGAGPHGSPSNRVGTAGLAHPRFWNSNWLRGNSRPLAHRDRVPLWRCFCPRTLHLYPTGLVDDTRCHIVRGGSGRLDAPGGSVIVASGLYTAHREQVRARQTTRETPRELNDQAVGYHAHIPRMRVLRSTGAVIPWGASSGSDAAQRARLNR